MGKNPQKPSLPAGWDGACVTGAFQTWPVCVEFRRTRFSPFGERND